MQKSQADNARAISWYLVLSLITCLPVQVQCQETKSAARPNPPEGVLLKPAPEFARWIITFSYPQDQPSRATSAHAKPSDPNLNHEVTVTKFGGIVHEETVSVSGDKFDKWQTPSKYYIKPKGQSYWGECDAKFANDNPTSDARRLPLPASGFRDLDWIDGKTYAGTVKERGDDYLMFVPASVVDVNFSDVAAVKAQPVIAYVDAVTRFPVMYKNRNVVQQYTFTDAPPEGLSLPASLTGEIKDGAEKRAKVFGTSHKEY